MLLVRDAQAVSAQLLRRVSLSSPGANYEAFDVLQSPALRDGIKKFRYVRGNPELLLSSVVQLLTFVPCQRLADDPSALHWRRIRWGM